MEDIIKKFLYTSVGLASQTTTKIREMIEELIRDRKITEEEGKRIVEDFSNKTKSQSKDLEEQLRSFSSKFNKEASSSAEEEIIQLKERIQSLENKLNPSGNKPTEANPHAPEADSRENEPLEEKKDVFRQKQHAQTDSVNKVVNEERVSLGDDILTPEKKMEAEQQRMQNQSNRPTASRREQDHQKANLSEPPLTPDKKVEKDKKEKK